MNERARLLVCDDCMTTRAIITALLEAEYDLLVVPSGEEALACAAEFRPDLIISDLIMEGMDGYQLCRQIRREPDFSNVPLILLTSKKTDGDSRAIGLEVGADDYLVKPIRPRELIARVNSLLRLRFATQDLERRTRELKEANATLQKAQDVLVQQEKLASLGQLVAGITHELNNPLNYVSGNVMFLKEHIDILLALVDRTDNLPGVTEEQKAAIENDREVAELDYRRTDLLKIISSIELGSRKANEIVRDLLAFARIGSGRMEDVHLHETLEMALSVLTHEFRDRILVTRDFAPVPLIRADASRLGQVFVNLLMNASQAIVGSGQIAVRIYEKDGLARCSIRDTGSGISPEVRGKIFDPFFSTKPVGKGTGLGLSITYGHVQQHGGRIEVESEPGSGSTFTVILPVSGPPPELQVEGELVAHPVRSRHPPSARPSGPESAAPRSNGSKRRNSGAAPSVPVPAPGTKGT